MNAPVTRRSLLGAAAVVGAVALPAITEAGTFAPDLVQSDAELFRLLDSYPAALAAFRLAADRCEALWEALSAEEPDRPEALHLRHDDGFGLDRECDIYQLRDGRHVRMYGLDEVDKLQARPQPTKIEESREPFPGHPDDVIVRTRRLPDERRIARRAEIIAASDAWWAAYQAVKDRLGIPAANEADDEATGALWAIDAAILATTPTTLAGLTAKSRWAAQCRLGAVFAADWHKRIVEDVIALAEREGALS